MAVELLPVLGLPAMEYDTVLYVALQAAQKIGMDGNDPDLTGGPDTRAPTASVFRTIWRRPCGKGV
jgi:hypothetical protein